jgi:hypothetical protein
MTGAAIGATSATPDEWMSYDGRLLTSLTDPRRYPAISNPHAAGVFGRAGDPADEFVFGLARILDGIGVLVNARR